MINIIIKVLVVWMNGIARGYFKEKSDKAIKTFNIFLYPIFNITFIFIMPKIYPAMLFEEYQYFLNVLFYGAFILAIYLWFFKHIMNKIEDMIKNYKTKNGGNDN